MALEDQYHFLSTYNSTDTDSDTDTNPCRHWYVVIYHHLFAMSADLSKVRMAPWLPPN